MDSCYNAAISCCPWSWALHLALKMAGSRRPVFPPNKTGDPGDSELGRLRMDWPSGLAFKKTTLNSSIGKGHILPPKLTQFFAKYLDIFFWHQRVVSQCSFLTFPNLRPLHPRRHCGMLPGITAGTVLRALHRAGREDGEICEAKGLLTCMEVLVEFKLIVINRYNDLLLYIFLYPLYSNHLDWKEIGILCMIMYVENNVWWSFFFF